MKKIFLILLSLVLITSCNSSLPTEDEEKIKIETSIIPLASITNYIGSEFVEVKSIVPAGVSPHGFDLKPQDMVSVENSDLIVYVGLEHIDGFLDKAISGKNVLNVSEGIELIEGVEEEEEEEHEEEEDHDHEFDPHIWSSPENARIIAEKITTKLAEISPENREYFEANLKKFNDELDSILSEFNGNIEGKNSDYFIIFHDAYNYLFNEIGIPLDKKLVFQTKVLSDPNLEEIKFLIDEVKEKNVKIAFKEPQLNDTNLKKFANEYNLTILNLDPLGKDFSANGYIKNLKENLESLKNIYN